MDLRVNVPEQSVLMNPAQSALALIESIVIDSAVMYEEAGDELKRVARRIDELDEQRKDLVGPLNDTVKRINDLFRGPLDLLRKGQTIIKGKMVAYLTEQERIAAEAKREAEAAARAVQERLDAEAAAARAQAEADAEALRSQAQEAAASGDVATAAALESRADSKLEAGLEHAAALEVAADAVAPAVLMESPKAVGISARGTWKAEVTDKAALIAFIATRPDLLHLVDVNQSGLNAMAKALKDAMTMPGVRAYQERTIAARRAA